MKKILKEDNILDGASFTVIRRIKSCSNSLRNRNEVKETCFQIWTAISTNTYSGISTLIQHYLVKVLELTNDFYELIKAKEYAVDVLEVFNLIPRSFEHLVKHDDEYLYDLQVKFKGAASGKCVTLTGPIHEPIHESHLRNSTELNDTEDVALREYYLKRKAEVVKLKTNPPTSQLQSFWRAYKKSPCLDDAYTLYHVLSDLICLESVEIHPSWKEFVLDVMEYKVPQGFGEWVNYSLGEAAFAAAVEHDYIRTNIPKGAYSAFGQSDIESYKMDQSSYRALNTDLDYLIASKVGKDPETRDNQFDWFEEELKSNYTQEETNTMNKTDKLQLVPPVNYKEQMAAIEARNQPVVESVTTDCDASDLGHLNNIKELDEKSCTKIDIEAAYADILAILKQDQPSEFNRVRQYPHIVKDVLKVSPGITVAGLREMGVLKKPRLVANPNLWFYEDLNVKDILSREREDALVKERIDKEIEKLKQQEIEQEKERVEKEKALEEKRRTSNIGLASMLHDLLLRQDATPLSITMNLGDHEIIIKSK